MGTTIVLTSGNGGSGNNYTSTLFDDDADQSITEGSAPFTGTYSPEDAFANMIHENPNGNWILYIYDDFPADAGTLNSWSLIILGADILPPPNPPENVTTYPGDGQATVSWNSSSLADSYSIYYSTVSPVDIIPGNLVDTVVDPPSPYDHTGLINETIYYYIIVAHNTSGDSLPSEEVTVYPSPPGIGEWLIMVYLDADNNLEDAGIDDFNEIEYGLYNLHPAIRAQVKILVLFDRIDNYDSSNGDWTTTRVYDVQPDNNMAIINSTQLQGWWGPGETELNMGNPQTLENFITFAQTGNTYVNHAIVIWNHGGGVRNTVQSKPASMKAIAWDDTDGGDALFLDEVQQAIGAKYNSSNKLSIIGMDACIMGQIEVAYEFRNMVEYMSFSPDFESWDGWDYEGLISGMTSTMTPEEFATIMVTTYHDSTSGIFDKQTQTAVNLAFIQNLKDKVDLLAIAMASENKKSDLESIRSETLNYTGGDATAYPYYALGDFANRIIENTSHGFSQTPLKDTAADVLDAIGQTVVYVYASPDKGNYYGPGATVKRGLGIFFSKSTSSYVINGQWYTALDSIGVYGIDYGFIDFAAVNDNDTVENWKELMEFWYDSAENNADSW
jgi:hypothetical protein